MGEVLGKDGIKTILQALDSDGFSGESAHEYEELTRGEKRLAEAIYQIDTGAAMEEDYDFFFQRLFGVSTKEKDGTPKNLLDIFKKASEKI